MKHERTQREACTNSRNQSDRALEVVATRRDWARLKPLARLVGEFDLR